MNIENLQSYDPFADTGLQEDSKSKNLIHIRIQQRNGRKSVTTVQGLPKEYDPKRLLKNWKKEFSTNGNIVTDEIMGEVIQVQGDKRNDIKTFLVDTLGLKKEDVKVHGF